MGKLAGKLAGKPALAQIETDVIGMLLSEERLQTLLGMTRDGIVVTDCHGIVRFANHAAQAMLDAAGGNLLGTQFGYYSKIGEPVEIEIAGSKGTRSMVELRCTTIDWEGEAAYLTTLHDITERKFAEQAINKAQNELDSVVEARTLELQQSHDTLARDIVTRKRLEQDLRAREARQHTQQTVLLELVSNKNLVHASLENALVVITQAAARALNVAQVSIWFCNQDHSEIHCQDMYQRNRRCHTNGSSLKAADYPLYFSAIGQNRVIAIDDVHRDPRTGELVDHILAPLAISSILVAPIRQSGATAGIVCFDHIGPQRRWHLDEQNFAGSIADMVTLALEQASRKLAEDKLRLAARIFECTSEGVMVIDTRGKIESVNPAFAAITGYRADEVMGKKPDLLRSGRHDEAFYATLWAALLGTGCWQGQVWKRRKDGEVYPEWETISAIYDEQGDVTHYVSVFHDISERVQQEQQMWQKAHHDPLTGLPNRALFLDRLKVAMAHAERHGHLLAVLFLDLDHFKEINDTYGHLIGDKLLETVAKRLLGCVRREDTVSRLAGDEFTVLLPKVQLPGDTVLVAKKILKTLQVPMQLNNTRLRLDLSIGIAIFPQDANQPEALIECADSAMYQAKQQGRGRYMLIRN